MIIRTNTLSKHFKALLSACIITTLLFSISMVSFAYTATDGAFITSNGTRKYYTSFYNDTSAPLYTPNGEVYWVKSDGSIITNNWIYGISMEDQSVQKWYYARANGSCKDNGLTMDNNGGWYLFDNFYMVNTPGLKYLSQYDGYVYIASESGICWDGFLNLDGYTYYFARPQSDGTYLPVSRGECLMECYENGTGWYWCAFNSNHHKIDLSDINTPTVIDIGGGKRCIALGPDTFAFDGYYEIDGMKYLVNGDGYVIREEVADTPAEPEV